MPAARICAIVLGRWCVGAEEDDVGLFGKAGDASHLRSDRSVAVEERVLAEQPFSPCYFLPAFGEAAAERLCVGNGVVEQQ